MPDIDLTNPRIAELLDDLEEPSRTEVIEALNNPEMQEHGRRLRELLGPKGCRELTNWIFRRRRAIKDIKDQPFYSRRTE